MVNEYALYRGEEFVDLGTYEELAERTGLTKSYIMSKALRKNTNVKVIPLTDMVIDTEYLTELVEKEDMTFDALVKTIRTSRYTLIDIMSGKNKRPSMKAVNRLCEYFGLEPVELYKELENGER